MNPMATIFSLLDSLKRNTSLRGMEATAERAGGQQKEFAALVDKSLKGDQAATDAATSAILDNVVGNAPGAIGGMILPALAGGAKLGQIKAANRLLSEGKASEAYRTFGIYADPVTNHLLKVIPDTGSTLNPVNVDIDSLLTGLNSSKQHNLADILKNNQTLDAAPELGKFRVGRSISYDNGSVYTPVPNTAAHNSGVIAIGNTTQSTKKPDAVTSFISNLLHETQHGIQYLYDLPSGGGPKHFLSNPAQFETAIKKLKDKAQITQKAADIDSYKSLHDVYINAFKNYRHLPGEVQSNLVQRMYETGDYTTHPIDLMKQMGINIPKISDDITNKVDTDPYIQYLISNNQ